MNSLYQIGWLKMSAKEYDYGLESLPSGRHYIVLGIQHYVSWDAA